MDELSDPRKFGSGGAGHPLLEPVTAVTEASGLEQRMRRSALNQLLRARLLDGDDAAIREALGAMPDAVHFRTLHEAIAQAAESPEAEPQAVQLRLFALPLVLVAAAPRRTRIACVLPDIAGVRQLFERRGVLGPMQNFGLNPALCAREALEALTPVTVFNAASMIDPQAIEARLPAADVCVSPGREQTHLRFLAGAGVARAHGPDIGATGSNIGRWGSDLSRLVGAQLAAPGAQLLVLPRMPKGLVRAPHAGRSAQLEVALNVFVSNTVRRFRMSAGDPVAILSTHADGDLRLTLSVPFADELVEGFRWPLAPLDDLPAIGRDIEELLVAVRVSDVRAVPEILPAKRAAGGDWYPRVGEWESMVAATARH